MSRTASRLQTQLLGTVFLLIVFGQIMLFSASGVLGLWRHGSEFYYVVRQALCAVIGLSLIYLISRIKHLWWERLAYPIILFQIVLIAATLLPGFSHNAQGASRWLRISGFTFQPGELSKISLSIFLAYTLALRENKRLTPRRMVFHGLLIGVLLFLIFKQPDLGMVILLACVALGMFFVSGLRLFYLLGALGMGLTTFLFLTLHSDYRRRRLYAFLNPWADPQGSGFQTIQSLLSFHSGKLFGAGLGNGNSKLFFLPEVHTDFIYALVGEELGFIGALALLLLFIYLSTLLFRVVSKASTPFGRYLAFGLALSITLQVVVNLGGVTGIIPIKGLPLPFLSWGRSALITNCVMVGILLNIVRRSGIIPVGSAQK